jgi:hypothetical protein
MKKLSLNEMQGIQGGDGWGCAFAIAGVAVVVASALTVTGPVVGATALTSWAVTTGGSMIGFAGSMYSFATGACD